MTTSTRTAPPARAFSRRAPGPRPTPPRRARGRPPRTEPSFERILGWALLLSVVIHAGILLLSPRFAQVGAPPAPVAAGEAEPHSRGGLEWIVPVPREGAEEALEPVPETRRTPRETAPIASEPRPLSRPATANADPGPPEAAESTEGTGAREALRPGYRDGRLWVNPRDPAAAPKKSEHQRYLEHLHARIEAMNDSTSRGGPNTDWTFSDAEGRKWGLSEKGLHLGGMTIPRELLPLPGPTGPNASLEEQRERDRQRAEIERQEADGERARAREERGEAMRERGEKQRRGGGGSG